MVCSPTKIPKNNHSIHGTLSGLSLLTLPPASDSGARHPSSFLQPLGFRVWHTPCAKVSIYFTISFVTSSHPHSSPLPLRAVNSHRPATNLGRLSRSASPSMDWLAEPAPKINFAQKVVACIQSSSPTCGCELVAELPLHTFPEGNFQKACWNSFIRLPVLLPQSLQWTGSVRRRSRSTLHKKTGLISCRAHRLVDISSWWTRCAYISRRQFPEGMLGAGWAVCIHCQRYDDLSMMLTLKLLNSFADCMQVVCAADADAQVRSAARPRDLGSIFRSNSLLLSTQGAQSFPIYHQHWLTDSCCIIIDARCVCSPHAGYLCQGRHCLLISPSDGLAESLEPPNLAD